MLQISGKLTSPVSERCHVVVCLRQILNHSNDERHPVSSQIHLGACGEIICSLVHDVFVNLSMLLTVKENVEAH